MIIQTEVKVFPDRSKLPAKEADLLAVASEAAKHAYAPYSHFKVGAAVLLANGHIISGNNQENAVYPSGMCAERVALFYAAAQFPETPIVKIAITAKGAKNETDRPVPPCGSCRQSLLEYEMKFGEPIEIIMAGAKGEVYIVQSVADLLPLSFSSDFL
ncbi:MAG: cytidine deaminase [Bacteroidetes bacterium]|nr:cytidine deaminase [Bacteroidota bacterium]MCL2301953.1 cytidine deaminase [Lentimicrobiaceae bacterium]